MVLGKVQQVDEAAAESRVQDGFLQKTLHILDRFRWFYWSTSLWMVKSSAQGVP